MRTAGINYVLKNRFWGQIGAIIILFCILSAGVHSSSVVYAQDTQSEQTKATVFLPLISSSEQPQNPRSPIVLKPEEEAIEKFLLTDPNQHHQKLLINPTLVEQARRKAQDMADRVYFSHTDPDGFGPNYWVRKAGYIFPDYYGTEMNANNIESIAAGYGDADSVWKAWMASSGHRSHLLGENPFYQEQLEYGIGHVHKENGSFRDYWVVLISKPK